MSTRARSAVARMAAQRFPDPGLFADVVPAEPTELAAVGQVAGAGVRRRTMLRRGTVLSACLVVGAAVVLAVPHGSGGTAYAATAPTLRYIADSSQKETVTDTITMLADHAAAQPSPPGAGPYHYVHTREWNLSTDMTTDMRVLGARIQVTDRQQWIASNGSGQLKITADGAAAPGSGVYGPGKLLADFVTGDTVEDLRTALTRQNPHNTTAFDWIQTFNQVWGRQAVSPDLEVALLRTLAAQPGLTLSGTTTDRAGRTGIAISARSADGRGGTPAMRVTLIFDPETGMLLDYEKVALDAGSLPIRAPATIGYVVWLASGHTRTITELP